MPRIAGLLLCAAATASDVLFVHVGKTCGGTIAAELRKNRVAYHEVHLDKVDGETLAKYKRVIVSARDPVDRVVSAFNWRSPHACRKRNGGCTPPRAVEKFDGERGFYNCFPDVQHFVDAVTARSQEERQGTTLTCHMLAYSFFHGVGVGAGGGSHIGKGLSWYVGPVLYDLLRRESDLWVVRAEACEHDLEGAIRWLRGDDTLDVLRAVWKSTSELGRVDGVGRPKFDFHTGYAQVLFTRRATQPTKLRRRLTAPPERTCSGAWRQSTRSFNSRSTRP